LRTIFHFVRHAAHDNVGGFLAGRTEGIHLGPNGLAQAERLGSYMAGQQFSTITASPRERTQETAAAIARASGIEHINTDPRLDEVDFGAWSNRTFDDLNTDPEWRRWNTVRSLTATPAGETIFDVQARVLDCIRERHRGSNGAGQVLVTHADVIKVAVAYFLGLSLDSWPRFEISPASVTTLLLDDWEAKILSLNTPGG
jgi:broad specificity phosphatase PhoE